MRLVAAKSSSVAGSLVVLLFTQCYFEANMTFENCPY